MFEKLSNIFNKNKPKIRPDAQPLTDSNGNIIKESAIQYIGQNRLLKIPNTAAALIMYDDNRVEMVMQKVVADQQELSDREETLVAIATLMKDPQFCEILRMQFHKIAVNNLNQILQKEEE